MAWSSADQNPTMAPSPGLSSPNYAATLNSAAYYNPMGSGTTMAPTFASTAVPAGGSYADQLAAMSPPEPWETRETSRELATAADRTAAARRYTKEVSTTRGTSVRRQGDQAYDLLHPQSVQRFALAARQAHAEEIPVGINSAYRPPAMGIGGFRDKYKSTHAYGLGFDVSGIGGPGSKTARRWNEIATEYGLINPYGPNNRKEYNHYQLVPEKSAYQIPGLRNTITGHGPIDVEQMWAASGVDPEGVPYAGGMGGGTGRTVMAGGTSVPTPRQRPQGADVSSAYAPSPEAMDQSPFDAVLGTDRRPQPSTPRMRPQRDTLAAQPAPEAQPQRQQAPQGGYVVQRGDTLSAIAQRTLGDPNRWREIAQANSLRNPDMIQPGQRLVLPGQGTDVDVPQPRMRPSREVDIPLPRMRPPAVDPRRYEQTGITPRERLAQRERGGPVAPMTEMDYSMARVLNARQKDRIATGMTLPQAPMGGTPETQMSLDRSAPTGTPVYGNAAAVNRAAKGDFEGRPAPQAAPSPPAGPGMDTSGLIREPTAGERALQGNARVPLPTGTQPIDPTVAATIRRTPVVIVDPRSPPIYVSPSGVRVWAAR